MALTTRERVVQRLALPSGITTGINVEEIDSLIDEVDARLADFCSVEFWDEAAFDITVNGTGGTVIALPFNEITTITAVYEISGSGSESLVNSGSYRVVTKKGTLIKTSGASGFGDEQTNVWTYGCDNYRIVGTAGYSVIPAALTLVATEIVVSSLMARHQNLFNQSEAVNSTNSSTRTVAELIKDMNWRLSPYKRHF